MATLCKWKRPCVAQHLYGDRLLYSLPHVLRLIDEFLIEGLHSDTLKMACEQGAQVSDLDFVLTRCAPSWTDVVKSAAKGGFMHVFRWMAELEDVHRPWQQDFVDGWKEASEYGHLDVVKWMYERGYPRKEALEAMRCAAANGHFEVVKFLYDNYPRCNVSNAAASAAHNGHLEIVKLLRGRLQPSNFEFVVGSAASGGQFEVFQWLQNTGVCSEHVFREAVLGGCMNCANLAFKVSTQPPSVYVSLWAAKAGKLEMIQWLHEEVHAPFDFNTMNWAAFSGHLDVVKWLHENRDEGCSAAAMDGAARCGHLETVKWLHFNRPEGCTIRAMDEAAANGYLEVVKWLYANRSEGCTKNAMDRSLRQGHLEVAQWLHENGIKGLFPRSIRLAAYAGHLDVVCWYYENVKRSLVLPNAAALGRPELIYQIVTTLHSRNEAESRLQVCRACFLSTLEDHLGDRKQNVFSSQFWNDQVATDIAILVHEFHKTGVIECVWAMLELALELGYLSVVRSFVKQRGIGELFRSFMARSRGILMRWLIENGPPLDVATATKLAIQRRYPEVTRWLSESDNVVVICKGLQYPRQHSVLWMLETISFHEEESRLAIRSAVQSAWLDDLQWLNDNLRNADARSWLFNS